MPIESDGKGPPQQAGKLSGRCDGMKGHVYEYKIGRIGDAFAKTMAELAIYASESRETQNSTTYQTQKILRENSICRI
jgi:hypothetical protein